jgi:hypothetical protein
MSFVDIDAEGQPDLRCNSWTAPDWVAPFHLKDGIDEFFGRPFRARSTPGIGRKQKPVLSFDKHVMETEQSGGSQNNRTSQNACGAHQKSAQPCNHPIRNPEIGSTLPAAIENQELMSNERGFGNNGTQPTWPR